MKGELLRHIRAYWDIIQPYSGIFRTLCNACIFRNLVYSESCIIQYSSIIASWRTFRTLWYLRKFANIQNLTYLKPDSYSELSLKFKIEEWPRATYWVLDIKNPVYYRKFKHLDIFTSYAHIFSHIVAYLEPCVTLASSAIFRILAYLKPKIYLELCPGIFWHIRTLCNARIFRTLPYLEFCHLFIIWAYLGPEAYSESCLFRQFQAYLITLAFFFYFNLT